MGVAERREREKQELREQILDAARTLFAREGYEAVTMRKIAEAIEYSPTAIYLYFKDKDDLLRELCNQDFRQLAHHFQAIAAIPDPVEKLRLTGRAYLEFGLTYPNHYRLMFMTEKPQQSCDDAELQKGNPDEDAYAFLKLIVSDCIAQGKFREDLSDPDTVAQILWAGVHGLVSLHIVMCDETWVDWRPLRELADTMFDVQLNGLLRHPRGSNHEADENAGSIGS
jgi:AcrR family transcriptional regulator